MPHPRFVLQGLLLLQLIHFEHIDTDINKVLLLPFQSGQHWSLLIPIVDGHTLYSVDSGHNQNFGHSDLQYAPAIGILLSRCSGSGARVL
jgi:hypothetical protein